MALKDKYFTISEAAAEACVTRQTISRWINQGKLQAEKIGRETLIEKEQLDELIDSRLSNVIFQSIDRKIIRIIQDKYKYKKEETIDAFETKRKPFAIGYTVLRSDGTSDEVWIYIGKIELSKDEPVVTFEIKNITRTVQSKRRGKM